MENQEKGIESDLMTLKNEIIARDYQDTHRKYSPLRQAEDAILIDSSDLSISEVTNKILKLIPDYEWE